MNEIKMPVKEAIEQLNDLKRDREGFAKNDEPDSVFAYDIKAIDVAIKALEDNIKLNKQNEEIQNRKIKYYYRAKDAEDRCKKIEQQNARLKELLKAAPGDIHTLLMSDNCEKVCRESGCHCTTVEQCRNICKWRYADEVEEVLGDE